MLTKTRLSALIAPLCCIILFTLCMAASHPKVEMGLNDDWSYDFSARVLASTGHIVYNGWATAMLGWQLYWGALFIRVFGFSFFILRVSTFVLSLLALIVLQRILARLGISRWNSALATLTMAFSPIFFLMSFSFMSDIPGLFSLLICLYLCIRALQAETDRAVILWLAVAALSNVVLGTVRQTSWLGVLLLVPCAAWCLRSRRRVLPVTAIFWALSCLLIALCMHWFRKQPYVLEEKLFTPLLKTVLLPTLVDAVRSSLSICLFVLPVLLAFLFRFPFRLRRARGMGLVAGCLLLGSTLFLALRHRPVYWLAPFTANSLTEKGFNDLPAALGDRATIFPSAARAGLTFLVVAALCALLICLWNARSLSTLAQQEPASYEFPDSHRTLSWQTLAVFLGPFTLVYVFLLVTRTVLWDRYLLPLLPLLLLVVVRLYQQKISLRLPALTLVVLALFAYFDVAALHDYFAQSRARLQVANNLLALGIPRTQIDAGFEYSAWTQLELTGYVNDKRLHNPAGAYKRWTRPDHLPHQCVLFFSDHTPSIVARYAVAYQPNACLAPVEGAPPVPYGTWLAPHDQAIYTGMLP